MKGGVPLGAHLAAPPLLHLGDGGAHRVPDALARDLERFSRAAGLLGQLAARLTRGDCLPATALRAPGEVTGLFYTGRLLPVAFPALADDAI